MTNDKVLVTGDMTIAEMIELYPSTAEILGSYGLGCAMCVIGQIETLMDGAMAHGMPLDEVMTLVTELNEVANMDYTERH